MSRPANSPAWADPESGLAWVLTPARDLESIAAHEIGHLLGADHATLTRYPQQCVSHGSAVQAAYTTGTQDAGLDSAGRTDR
jgi:Zn-dependent protease with chaperone function